ncbi:Uncharacterized protein APZ42_022542 [Daphnia magna]|uniref:Uncharacterized protein n=1 Tax=Daphnia magna TaxID=35525 RepID=A0A0P6C462_9CRUS|nr:Uncharacterized protein APZ42_022542 [Daphnia magna]
MRKLFAIHWTCLATILIGYYVVKIDSVAVSQPGHLHRHQKRSVISLPRGVLKFTGEFIVPVLSLINQTNSYLWFNFPTTWPLPNNNNLNTLYNSFGRLKEKGIEVDEDFVDEQRANQDRRHVYQYIEGFFQNFGVNGTACVQRAICEMAEAPLSSNGLLGKVVELVLTPSLIKMPAKMEPYFGLNRFRREVHEDAILEDLDFIVAPVEDEYTDAFHKGKDGLCWSHFASCPINIFKLLNL